MNSEHRKFGKSSKSRNPSMSQTNSSSSLNRVNQLEQAKTKQKQEKKLNPKTDAYRMKLIEFIAAKAGTCGNQLDLTDAPAEIVINVSDFSCLFVNARYDLSNVELINISNWNTSNATNMNFMFGCMNNLKRIYGLNTLNVSKVVSFKGMFQFCSSLGSVNLDTWKPVSVMSIDGMFMFSGIRNINLHGWNVPELASAARCFSCCRKLIVLRISDWKAPKLTLADSMLYGTSELDCLNMLNFDAPELINQPPNSDRIKNMFTGCAAYEYKRFNLPSLSHAYRFDPGNLKLPENVQLFCAGIGFKTETEFLIYKTKYDNQSWLNEREYMRKDNGDNADLATAIKRFEEQEQQLNKVEYELRELKKDNGQLVKSQTNTITNIPTQMVDVNFASMLAEKVNNSDFNNVIIELKTNMGTTQENVKSSIEAIKAQINKLGTDLKTEMETRLGNIDRTASHAYSNTVSNAASISNLQREMKNIKENTDKELNKMKDDLNKQIKTINDMLTNGLKTMNDKIDKLSNDLMTRINGVKNTATNNGKAINGINDKLLKQQKFMKSYLIDIGDQM